MQQLTAVPAFSRVRVHDFGSVEEIVWVPPILDDVVTVWTRCETAKNPLSAVEIRGVITGGHGLAWLPEDAKVSIVEPPQFAGMPEDLVKEARPVAPPEGSLSGGMVTPEGWPPLIWNNDLVFSPCQGWSDPETSVEVLLCALSVAPASDPELVPFLLAALKARYAVVKKDPRTYPPARYPWRDGRGPSKALLEYLEG